ncbi:MAG: 50S ribosomal protein L23 [bacterium]|jgi:large subunit ribosomal protein L23
MNNALSAIKALHITEKGTQMAGQNKYLFKVDTTANKLEIKQAVEDFFKVKVVKVNTMNYTGKKRRERTLHYGKKPDWKRAVVTLRAGDKIDLE